MSIVSKLLKGIIEANLCYPQKSLLNKGLTTWLLSVLLTFQIDLFSVYDPSKYLNTFLPVFYKWMIKFLVINCSAMSEGEYINGMQTGWATNDTGLRVGATHCASHYRYPPGLSSWTSYVHNLNQWHRCWTNKLIARYVGVTKIYITRYAHTFEVHVDFQLGVINKYPSNIVIL